MARRRKKTKAQRRTIANRNLVKARRARWKGHRKHKHRKKTRAQRRAIAKRNLKKAWAGTRKKHGHKKRKRAKRAYKYSLNGHWVKNGRKGWVWRTYY